MSPIRCLPPLLIGAILLAAPNVEKLRKRAASLPPGTTISLVMLKGKEIRGQMLSAEPQGVRLTTFRDNHIAEVEVPYAEMSGIRVRGGSGRRAVLDGFAVVGGLMLVLGLLYAAASGGRAIIAFAIAASVLTVQAQDTSRLKRKAVESQIGSQVEVVRLNGQKTRAVLLAVTDEGVEVRPGTAATESIRYEEMKDFRDKRPGHPVRNALAAFGICGVGWTFISLLVFASH